MYKKEKADNSFRKGGEGGGGGGWSQVESKLSIGCPARWGGPGEVGVAQLQALAGARLGLTFNQRVGGGLEKGSMCVCVCIRRFSMNFIPIPHITA